MGTYRMYSDDNSVAKWEEIDLEKVVLDKINKNAEKYPAAGPDTPRSTKCS